MSAETSWLAVAETSESSESENGSVQIHLNQWIQSASRGNEGARSALSAFFFKEIHKWVDSTTEGERRCWPLSDCVRFTFESSLRAWAETDDPEGQFHMGKFVDASQHPQINTNDWYKKAAEAGHSMAQFILGQRGEILWLRTSAEQGFPPAQRNLGNYYYRGSIGVLQSFEDAAKWWGKAAAGGDSDAIWCLGLLYAAGEGLPQDKKKALDLFREAAGKNKYYKYDLGHVFESGKAPGAEVHSAVEGFTPDLIQAHVWYNFANEEGVTTKFPEDYQGQEEKSGLARVTKKMSPAQLAEAQRLAKEWELTHK